jgi:hypothetical protein
MTRDEKLKAIQDMDSAIERAEQACQTYELMQMEMLATLARARAIHKQLIAKKVELQRKLELRSDGAGNDGAGAAHQAQVGGGGSVLPGG